MSASTTGPYHAAVDAKKFVDSQIVRDNMHHSMAEPMTAPRSSQPINDAVCYQDPEQRGMHMTVPEPSCSFKTSMAQPQHSFREQLKPPRDGPPPPPPPFHSHRHHFVQNMQRENFSSNHDRSKPPPYDYQERWNPPMPYSGPQYHDNGMHVPYGCHPCESTSLPGQGWRFPSQSMNHWDSMPYRPPYEDAVPVANRGPSYWRPR
ncbi:protein HUA2-LIKE 2 isoform X2 [Arachis duranensis]|uniref:Protein HUA2-LIKE 2 isoform X2 n=1 Tax=Arachis duranensis TaxID=130453 RepID=A0A9C6U1M1_ARADU|nr:protein HUA2-LIKE 2 isoform X2 [Arachis duranensis]